MNSRTISYILDSQGDKVFGPGPYELLSKIAETGSLSSAAREMNMSYTKAMRIVQQAERACAHKLTERSIGGEGGGSSQLTDYGKAYIRCYHLWAESVSKTANSLYDLSFAELSDTSPLGCVVLASGYAKRFGSQKLCEPFLDSTVFEHTLQAVPLDRVDCVVVTRWQEVRAVCDPLRVRCVEPSGPDISDSVVAGVGALGPKAGYIFVQADQPLLKLSSMHALIDSFIMQPEFPARLSYKGQLGSPIIFPGYCEQALMGISGDTGGSTLLKENPLLDQQTQLVEVADELELADIDTPDQWQQLVQAAQVSLGR